MKNVQASKDVPQPKPAGKKSSDEQEESLLYHPVAETHGHPRFLLAKQTDSMSKLPCELLVEIAKRLKKLEDFTCFISVSRHFLLNVEEGFFEGLHFRESLPYLMLPPVSIDGNDTIRQLYSLVEGESIVASLEVPKLKTTTKMYFESLGWLLTVEVDGSTSLLDPFSGTEIPVPHLHTFDPLFEWLMFDKRCLIHKMVLSSRPNETSDFIMVVIIGDGGFLSFWRLGDKSWNEIEYPDGSVCDVVHDGGEQFYVWYFKGSICVINFAAGHVEARIIIDPEPVVGALKWYGEYMVKTIDGSLLVIKRNRDKKFFLMSEFRVFDIDIETGTCKEMYSLGSMAVFIGRNSSIALDATAPKWGGVIKANHIYFTDDLMAYQDRYFTGDDWRAFANKSPDAIGGSVDNGVFNFETGAIEPVYPVEPLLSHVCPAMWITPNICV